jgi:hypothetical protein
MKYFIVNEDSDDVWNIQREQYNIEFNKIKHLFPKKVVDLLESPVLHDSSLIQIHLKRKFIGSKEFYDILLELENEVSYDGKIWYRMHGILIHRNVCEFSGTFIESWNEQNAAQFQYLDGEFLHDGKYFTHNFTHSLKPSEIFIRCEDIEWEGYWDRQEN